MCLYRPISRSAYGESAAPILKLATYLPNMAVLYGQIAVYPSNLAEYIAEIQSIHFILDG